MNDDEERDDSDPAEGIPAHSTPEEQERLERLKRDPIPAGAE